MSAQNNTHREKADDERPGRSAWMPHVWAIVVPFGAVLAAYLLWFGFMALLRLPDWLANARR